MGDSKYRTDMEFEYLGHASTAPDFCFLMYVMAINHETFCSHKPEEVILDPSDAADYRSVEKPIPVIDYHNGKSTLTHFELSSRLWIALRCAVYCRRHVEDGLHAGIDHAVSDYKGLLHLFTVWLELFRKAVTAEQLHDIPIYIMMIRGALDAVGVTFDADLLTKDCSQSHT